jgi:hypothetical protein
MVARSSGPPDGPDALVQHGWRIATIGHPRLSRISESSARREESGTEDSLGVAGAFGRHLPALQAVKYRSFGEERHAPMLRCAMEYTEVYLPLRGPTLHSGGQGTAYPFLSSSRRSTCSSAPILAHIRSTLLKAFVRWRDWRGETGRVGSWNAPPQSPIGLPAVFPLPHSHTPY